MTYGLDANLINNIKEMDIYINSLKSQTCSQGLGKVPNYPWMTCAKGENSRRNI